MRYYKFFIILPLLCWAFVVRAQEVQEPSSMPEQWQLTLDVIKSKAQTLMIKNNGLQLEHQQLIGRLKELQQSINDQQDKNAQVDRFLKERHGRTDQQLRIDELTQDIKMKRQAAGNLDGQLEDLKRKQADMGQKIQQLKDTISNIESRQQVDKHKAQALQHTTQQGDDQLAQYRHQLEDENRQEVLLENKLTALKTGDQIPNLDGSAIEKENKQLEEQLDNLRLQKLRHIKKSSNDILGQANRRRYGQLKKRKDQLEADINAYEFRLDALRESSLMALSWKLKKKKLVHEMVQVDARNNQMQGKIKVLKEDIDVLRDQVAKLERRVDFAQGKI